jgi:hypothetical protein
VKAWFQIRQVDLNEKVQRLTLVLGPCHVRRQVGKPAQAGEARCKCVRARNLPQFFTEKGRAHVAVTQFQALPQGPAG